MEKKIVGFRKFNSKKGTPCCIVYMVSPFTDRQLQNGGCGQETSQEFIPEDFHALINAQSIGKLITINKYESGGRLYIDTVSVK